ncbi:hypothetical protein [Agrobacterium sp. SORGH_AS 787]|uniref:hypothetical protein n=1 Tax=Agrobacterium sp. SORGH_AS 787 TaxID=3041775 RepID=UPI0032B74F48
MIGANHSFLRGGLFLGAFRLHNLQRLPSRVDRLGHEFDSSVRGQHSIRIRDEVGRADKDDEKRD